MEEILYLKDLNTKSELKQKNKEGKFLIGLLIQSKNQVLVTTSSKAKDLENQV